MLTTRLDYFKLRNIGVSGRRLTGFNAAWAFSATLSIIILQFVLLCCVSAISVPTISQAATITISGDCSGSGTTTISLTCTKLYGTPAAISSGWINAALPPYNLTSYCGASSVTSADDQAPAINAALNTGLSVLLPAGCFPVYSDIKFVNGGQMLTGVGPSPCGQFTSANLSSCNPAGPPGGGVVANGGTLIFAPTNTCGTSKCFTNGILDPAYSIADYYGGSTISIENLTVAEAQPDTASRSSLTSFPPTVYARNVTRFRMRNVRLEECIICLDAQNNSGGMILEMVEMSGFGTTTTGGTANSLGGLIIFDGSLDINRLTDVHEWIFGLTANQAEIMASTGTVCLNSGRMDGLYIANWLSECGTGMNLFYGTGGAGGNSWATGGTSGGMVNGTFDTYGNFQASGSGSGSANTGPTFTFTNVGFSMAEDYPAITESSGSVNCSNCTFFMGGASGTIPIISETNATGGSQLTISNSSFQSLAFDTTSVSTSYSGSGTGEVVLILDHNFFTRSVNTTYNNPTIVIGTSTRANVDYNYTFDKGSNLGTFIYVPSDNFNIINYNNAPGWTITVPTGTTTGIYAPNL